MTAKDIETAVTKLPLMELKVFRSWFGKFDTEEWDEQFNADVKAGKLDHKALFRRKKWLTKPAWIWTITKKKY